MGLSALAVLNIALVSACSSPQQSEFTPGQVPETPAGQPYNKILDRPNPPVRKDCFYKTTIERGGKTEVLDDRMTSNGRGFVAYCIDPKFVDNGYYLFNFFGHSSYFVNLAERSYKVALTSPADDLLLAYQDAIDNRLPASYRTELKPRKIGPYECRGFSYKIAGGQREEWIDKASLALVEQKIERTDEKVKRKLVRLQDCETTLLRLPSGFNLAK
jgi:hypothetical protein